MEQMGNRQRKGGTGKWMKEDEGISQGTYMNNS